jgi:hypothetical protein
LETDESQFSYAHDTNFLLVGVNLLLCIEAKTQNIEFFENKGQWDSKARFGAAVNNPQEFKKNNYYSQVDEQCTERK